MLSWGRSPRLTSASPMPYPQIQDDGRHVTLDLHGATVDDALRLARRAVAEAHARGRAQLRLVHGTSTSVRDAYARTIKHALHDALDDGDLGPGITSALRGDGALTLAFDLGAQPDRRPLRMADLQGR